MRYGSLTWPKLIVLGLFIVLAQAALQRVTAQSPAGTVYAIALTACGSGGPTYTNGLPGPITMNLNGSLCVNQ